MRRRQDVGRIAFRVEGEWWNAYWAPRQDSMEGAVSLGSVRMNLASDPTVKASFMEAMKQAFVFAVKDAVGIAPTWNDPVPAPERERSGRA
jgi:hypothetical protein